MKKYIVYLEFQDKDGDIVKQYHHHTSIYQAKEQVKDIKTNCEKLNYKILELDVYEKKETGWWDMI